MSTYMSPDADEFVIGFATMCEDELYKCQDCGHESHTDLVDMEVTWASSKRDEWEAEVEFTCPSCEYKNTRKYGEERY